MRQVAVGRGDQAAVCAERHRDAAGAERQHVGDAQVEVSAASQRPKLITVRPEPVGARQRAAEPAEVALAAGMQHVDGDQSADRLRLGHDRREVVVGQASQGVGAAEHDGVAAAEPRQVEVGELQQPRRARHVPGWPLSVGPDRQDRRRGLRGRLPDQPAGVDLVPGQRGHENLGQQVGADRAERADAGAELRKVDRGPGRSAGRGGPDLIQAHAALPGRDRLDRTAEHVDDVRPDHGHPPPGHRCRLTAAARSPLPPAAAHRCRRVPYRRRRDSADTSSSSACDKIRGWP